jgi:hypothetical protein
MSSEFFRGLFVLSSILVVLNGDSSSPWLLSSTGPMRGFLTPPSPSRPTGLFALVLVLLEDRFWGTVAGVLTLNRYPFFAFTSTNFWFAGTPRRVAVRAELGPLFLSKNLALKNSAGLSVARPSSTICGDISTRRVPPLLNGCFGLEGVGLGGWKWANFRGVTFGADGEDRASGDSNESLSNLPWLGLLELDAVDRGGRAFGGTLCACI